MKYLLLLYAPALPEDPGSAEYAQLWDGYVSAMKAMTDAGVFVDCEPLQPPSASTTLRIRNGETIVTDGPAAEIKEQFGGYTLVECADLDEALRWAATLPPAVNGAVEVRPVRRLGPPA